MKQRDDELVNYNEMIPYETFLEKLKEKYPNNCLMEEKECPYRKQLKDSEETYLTLIDQETNTAVTDNGNLIAIDPDSNETLAELEMTDNGYKVNYKRELSFSSPYSENTIYSSERDKYTVVRSDCNSFGIGKYTYTKDDINKVIYLTKCNDYGNIYIPKEYLFEGIKYQIIIKYEVDISKYSKPFGSNRSYHYVNNPFFTYGLSIRNVVIEDGVKIYCNNFENDASYLFSCLCNMEYAKYPKEIQKADYVFAYCVSLKAVGIDELPYTTTGMFLGCEFIEDLSYIEIPDDGSKQRSQLLRDCNSLKNGDKLFKFKDEYTKPLNIQFYMYGGYNYLNTCTLESFNFPNIDNISSYANSFVNCNYLTEVSGTISKYAKNLDNLLNNCPNVTGFLNIDCIWFDELFFTKTNAFNTCSDDMSEPLVLIPRDYNKDFVSLYVDTLPFDNNVRIQDTIDNYDYEISDDIVILKRYNGDIRRLYVPDTFKINGAEYFTVIYSGDIDGTSLIKKGCFSNNTTITHISFGDKVYFFNDKLNGLFFGCKNLIKGIDLRRGVDYSCAYAYCSNLRGTICIDATDCGSTEFPGNIFYGITKFKSDFNYFVNCSQKKYYLKPFSSIEFFIKDGSEPRTIIKNNKKFVVLETEIIGNVTMYIPPYHWINGEKYYTCFANPKVEGETVTGIFQTASKHNVEFYLINSNQIIEFEDDNMDYMFYELGMENQYCGFIRNMKNISQNITSAKYSFFNSGVIFTKFNFGILDVRFACAVDTSSNINYINPFDYIPNNNPIPNSILYMDYFMTNFNSSKVNRIYLPYMVETANFAFYFYGLFDPASKSKFGYYVDDSLSSLPLLRLKKCNYLFNEISCSSAGDLIRPNITISSNQMIIINPGEDILLYEEPEMNLKSNITNNGYGCYKVLSRIYLDYHNSKINKSTKQITSTTINIKFNSSIPFSPATSGGDYYLLIFSRKTKSNKIVGDGALFNINAGIEVNSIEFEPETALEFGDELILVITNNSNLDSNYFLNNIPNEWYNFSTYASTTYPVNLNILESDNKKLFNKVKGNFSKSVIGTLYLTDTEKEIMNSLYSVNDCNGMTVDTNYVVNYVETDNNFSIESYTEMGQSYTRYKLSLNLNQSYKLLRLNTSDLTASDDFIVCIKTENGEKIIPRGSDAVFAQGAILLNENIYLINDPNVYISIHRSETIRAIFYRISSMRYDTDIMPNNITSYDGGEKYYLKAKIIIRKNDWVFFENENRYRAIKEIEGSSDIPEFMYSIEQNNDSTNYEDCIDTIIPKNGEVHIYTKENKCPDGDVVIGLYLLLGNEYGIVMPPLPTFDDNTGNVDGKWICPFRAPYVLCESHAYNIYKAYWYNCYDGRKSYDLLENMNTNVSIPSEITNYDLSFSYSHFTDKSTPNVTAKDVFVVAELFYDKCIKDMKISAQIKFNNTNTYPDTASMQSMDICVYIDNNDFKSFIDVDKFKEIMDSKNYGYKITNKKENWVRSISLRRIDVGDYETRIHFTAYFVNDLDLYSQYTVQFDTEISYKGDVK